MAVLKMVFAVLSLLVLCPGWSAADQLVLAGSGSNLPGIRLLIDAFRKQHPRVSFAPVVNIGSSGAIQAVADGAISLGLISRPLKESEKRHRLIVTPYAHTAVVVATHPGVPDTDLTSADLIDIYRGIRTTWNNGTEIMVLTREPEESTTEMLMARIPGFAEAYRKSLQERRWMVVMRDELMNRKLIDTPGAIGFSDMGSIISEKLAIKPLKLDGIPPSPAQVRNGTYPLRKTLAFVCRKDRLTPSARAFIGFSCSAEGHRLLESNGYVAY